MIWVILYLLIGYICVMFAGALDERYVKNDSAFCLIMLFWWYWLGKILAAVGAVLIKTKVFKE